MELFWNELIFKNTTIENLHFDTYRLEQALNKRPIDFLPHIDNLIRLRLLEFSLQDSPMQYGAEDDQSFKVTPKFIQGYQAVDFTMLGEAFMKSVTVD